MGGVRADEREKEGTRCHVQKKTRGIFKYLKEVGLPGRRERVWSEKTQPLFGSILNMVHDLC